jgi:hypothetical protein
MLLKSREMITAYVVIVAVYFLVTFIRGVPLPLYLLYTLLFLVVYVYMYIAWRGVFNPSMVATLIAYTMSCNFNLYGKWDVLALAILWILPFAIHIVFKSCRSCREEVEKTAI